jgi:hypothetical protein
MIQQQGISIDIKNEGEFNSRDTANYSALGRVFHTAMVNSKLPASSGCSADTIEEIVQTQAFRSILESIHALAERRQMSADAAALEIIRSFQKIDQLWSNLLVQQGIEKIKSSK